MLGEGTLFFTKKGFKPLKKLNIYDEVLTQYGTFEPITLMSPWQTVTKEYNLVTASTGEIFVCDDNVLWHVVDGCSCYREKVAYTDELSEKIPGSPRTNRYASLNIMDLVDCDKKLIYNPYQFAVVVPTCVPFSYIISNKKIRKEFLAGLIDSPMCSVYKSTAVYKFYTEYAELSMGIVTLARTLGYPVVCHFERGVAEIIVYVNDSLKSIPIKDEYKKLNRLMTKLGNKMKFKSIRKLSNDTTIKARSVKVNGGSAVIGYSLIPISCR